MHTTRWLGLVSFVLVGCAADAAQQQSESTEDALVSSAWSDNVEVLGDRLVFAPAVTGETQFKDLTEKIKAGKETVILFGKRQANAVDADGSIKPNLKNPNGYLRKAIGVGPTPNIILTKPATIAEANVELERAGLLNNVTRERALGDDDHWSWAQSYPFNIARVDLNKILYEKTFGAGIGTVRVRFKDSFINVNGNLDASVAGRWVSPRSASAVLTTSLEGQLMLEGSFDGAMGISSGDINMFHRTYDITSVGGFPLTLDFGVTGTCELAANGRVVAQAGERLVGKWEAGATYNSDAGFAPVWRPEWPKFQTIQPTVSTSARIEGRCTITAAVRVALFDALGPEASASAFVNVNAEGNTSGASGQGRVTVVGGVDARVGGTLRPFGYELAAIDAPPFHREWTLYDATVSH